MANSTRTYPSTQIEVLDGNLVSATSLPEDVVLILGKAYKGPTGSIYNVPSVKDATTAYGASSPIIKQMQKAYAAGAKNVALYRVGGRVSTIENLFGLGTEISTVEASSTADNNLKVYVGPEPLSPNKDTVIVYRNDKIVYSTTTTGALDAGYVDVTGFSKTDNTLYVGSFYEPVPFNEVATEVGHRVIEAFTDTREIELVTYDAARVSNYGFTVLVDGRRTTNFTLVGKNLTIDAAVIGSKTTYTVEVSYVHKLTPQAAEEAEVAYVAGQDLINSTWKQVYEAFDQALTDLSVPSCRAIVIGDLFNVPNITSGDTVANRLEYLNIEVDEWGEKTYEWSTAKYIYKAGNTTTLDADEADLSGNGEPVILKRFHEVDFVHRAGMWALDKTETEGFFPNIVVGAIGPRAYSDKYINQWVGKLPTYNLEGQILSNGSGLLGHRYMVGQTDYAGGYYATDTGFPDGSVLLDSGDTPIDLGKYLSIVVAQGVLTTESSITTGNITSAAASYAGIIASIEPGNGTTNATVNGIFNTIELKKARLRDLNNVGYVAFTTKTKGLSVLSGSVASRSTSDFQYVGTSVVMNVIAQDILDTCDPYIGNGIDGTLMVSLHTALHSLFAQRQTAGYFTGYTIKLSQVGPNTLKVRYKIKAKDELRVVTNEVSLEREISTEIIG